MSFPRFVALVSDSGRAAVARWLAERASARSGVVLFAADSDELARSVTSESLVVVEGSRLAELAAVGRWAHASGAHVATVELGPLVDSWLVRLPSSTRTVWHAALQAPRAWSVKRVAHAAGVSTRQLVRQCHLAGCAVPPKDLLLAARLVAAHTQLLGSRRATARELAHACGWVDTRSLRAALRRARLASVASLGQMCDGRATLSDMVARLVHTHA